MKFLVVGLVLFLSLGSFRSKDEVTLEIEGNPECLVNEKDYIIQVILNRPLTDKESLQINVNGVALTYGGKRNTFNGHVSTDEKNIVFSVSIQNNRTKKVKLLLTRNVSVCN